MITREDFHKELFEQYIIFKHDNSYCVVDKIEKQRCFELLIKNKKEYECINQNSKLKYKVPTTEKINIMYLNRDSSNKFTIVSDEKYLIEVEDLNVGYFLDGLTILVG